MDKYSNPSTLPKIQNDETILNRWFTRSYSIKMGQDGVIHMNPRKNKKNPFYMCSFELQTTPGRLQDTNYISFQLKGRAWVSIKFIELLADTGKMRKNRGHGWRKHDCVREVEIFLNSSSYHTVRLHYENFIPKPVNTSFRSFLHGITHHVDKGRIVNIEVTLRKGQADVKDLVLR